MTLENLNKHHARLKWLSSGEFTERDFDYKIKANDDPNGEKGEGGWCSMGDFENKMGNKRKDLIISDAKKTLIIFEEKYPEFKEKAIVDNLNDERVATLKEKPKPKGKK